MLVEFLADEQAAARWDLSRNQTRCRWYQLVNTLGDRSRSGGRPRSVRQEGGQGPAVDCGVLYRVARTGGFAAVVEGATSMR